MPPKKKGSKKAGSKKKGGKKEKAVEKPPKKLYEKFNQHEVRKIEV
jgi:hypothetical protein